MIGVTGIKLERAEGPVSECGIRTFATYEEAEAQLRKWAYSAPKDGGYDKVDVVINFADGEIFKARYDLYHPDREVVDLLGWLKDILFVMAGKQKPSYWTRRSYNRWLARHFELRVVACSLTSGAYDLGRRAA